YELVATCSDYWGNWSRHSHDGLVLRRGLAAPPLHLSGSLETRQRIACPCAHQPVALSNVFRFCFCCHALAPRYFPRRIEVRGGNLVDRTLSSDPLECGMDEAAPSVCSVLFYGMAGEVQSRGACSGMVHALK